tara:strand:- start:321 stop:620 length:300 start_codon:yes stop_codon:yes gene_type:complete
MDDLRICNKLAEIEGHETLPLDEYQEGDFYIVIDNHGEGYNPLKDDALCFQLMIKYCIELKCYPNKKGVYQYYVSGGSFDNGCDNPNKAICLAILEIYK